MSLTVLKVCRGRHDLVKTLFSIKDDTLLMNR